MANHSARAEVRRRTYGERDLAALHVFAGGFINFGYWRDIPLDGALTVDHRIAAQQALYATVLDTLHVTPTDRVLEVGCGQGVGAREVVARGPRLVHGVDLVPEQVQRARRNAPEALFTVGAAEDLPFDDDSFERVLSVEAAQHFEDLAGFARECARVLVPGGRLAVTTFFAAPGAEAELHGLLKTFENGLDLAHTVAGFLDDLRAAGFVDVRAESIGAHVWEGLDRWLAQGPHRDHWDRNWLRAARRGLVDYHLVTARQPAGSEG